MEKYLWTAHVEKIDLERDATVEREDVNKNRLAEKAGGRDRTLLTWGRAFEPTTSLGSARTARERDGVP